MGGQLCHGPEHKVPVVHIRVRQSEGGIILHKIVVEQNVQIQRPGAPVHQPLTLCRLLNGVQHLQQLLRGVEGFQLHRAVEEILLLHAAVGGGDEVSADLFQADAGVGFQGFHSPVKIPLFVAHVGAEGHKAAVPAPLDADGNAVKGQGDGGAGFFQLQLHRLQQRKAQ